MPLPADPVLELLELPLALPNMLPPNLLRKLPPAPNLLRKLPPELPACALVTAAELWLELPIALLVPGPLPPKLLLELPLPD